MGVFLNCFLCPKSIDDQQGFAEDVRNVKKELVSAFIQAVKEINDSAFEEEGGVGISFKKVGEGGQYEGNLSKMPAFDVSITSKLMDYEVDGPIDDGHIIYLGRWKVFEGREQDLREAMQNGKTTQLYKTTQDDWIRRFSNELSFFKKHAKQILGTKKRVGDTFQTALQEVQQYAADRKWPSIHVKIQLFGSTGHKELEPLYQYELCKQDPHSQQETPIGRIRIVAEKEFKCLVKRGYGEEYRDLLTQTAENMKNMVKNANRCYVAQAMALNL